MEMFNAVCAVVGVLLIALMIAYGDSMCFKIIDDMLKPVPKPHHYEYLGCRSLFQRVETPHHSFRDAIVLRHNLQMTDDEVFAALRPLPFEGYGECMTDFIGRRNYDPYNEKPPLRNTRG